MKLRAVHIDNEFNQLSLQSNPLVEALNKKEETVKEIPVVGSLAETVAEALNQIFAKNGGLPIDSRTEHLGEDLGDADPNQFRFSLGRKDVLDDFDNHQATLLTIQDAGFQGMNDIGYTDVAEDIAASCHTQPSVVIVTPSETIPEALGEMIATYVQENIKVFLTIIVPNTQRLEDVEFEEGGLTQVLENNPDKVNVYLTHMN